MSFVLVYSSLDSKILGFQLHRKMLGVPEDPGWAGVPGFAVYRRILTSWEHLAMKMVWGLHT